MCKEDGSNSKKESSFSILWFIFWLIIFWPVAIIYAVYKHFNRE